MPGPEAQNLSVDRDPNNRVSEGFCANAKPAHSPKHETGGAGHPKLLSTVSQPRTFAPLGGRIPAQSLSANLHNPNGVYLLPVLVLPWGGRTKKKIAEAPWRAGLSTDYHGRFFYMLSSSWISWSTPSIIFWTSSTWVVRASRERRIDTQKAGCELLLKV